MPNKAGALGLHCAAQMGHVGVLTNLLAKGTFVDVKTKVITTTVFVIHFKINYNIKDGYTALHVAVQSGKPSVIEQLLGNGANVHVTGGASQETPLHIAAGLTGKTAKDCAEMLLKSGGEANVKLTVRVKRARNKINWHK
jgi:ankyrin repeat protein